MSNPLQVEDRWQFNGYRAIVLSNSLLRVVILPELGGKISSLEYRPAGHEWLWQNQRIAPQKAAFGSRFDDHWSGGIDMFFPSCFASHWDDETVPDSGEWWSIPWSYEIEREDAAITVTLQAGGRIWPVQSKRTIRIDGDSGVVTFGVEITNLSQTTLPYLLGFHPALRIEPGYRIHLPPGKAEVIQSSGSWLGEVNQQYEWPLLEGPAGGMQNMAIIPDKEQNVFGGHFFTPSDSELWWTLTDPKRSLGVGLVTSTECFKGFWMWKVYGGWRGYYHLALEPWTAFPITLHEAVEQGKANWIKPNETYSTEIKMVVFEGNRNVSRISLLGDIEYE